MVRLRQVWWATLWLLAVSLQAARAQDAAPPDPAGTEPAPASLPATPPESETQEETSPTDTLSDEQGQVAEKYRRLEDLIFKMADFEATSNPRRAALLKQAYKQSKDRLTQAQLATVVELLSQRQYKRALDGQEIARKDLQELLQLLLSEDRSDRLKSEAERAREHIKELKRLQRLQRGVRGQTEAGGDPKELADKQAKVADRTGQLAQELESENAQAAGQGSESDPDAQQPKPAPAQAKPGDQPQEDAAQPDQQQPDENQPPQPDGTESQEQPRSGQPGDPNQDAKQPDAQGEPAPSSPQDSPPPSSDAPSTPSDPQSAPPPAQDSAQTPPAEPDDPARKRVREAEQKMREAQQRLEEAKRSESVEKQNEALEKLQQAITELEEVLRQLREEEMERVLALLEGRFRQMLEEEIKIYEATKNLDETPEAQRGRSLDIRAGKLAFDQRKVAGQADRCLTLLLEEGSSVAFPEVVEQIRDDMESVSDRLAESRIGIVTQDLEQEIISSLEEMIAAFQKAQQDLEEQRPPQPGEPGEGGQQPLVDGLAELKMIRSLQMRVNVRTQRYAKLLENVDDPVGQAVSDDLRQALGELSERQARIHAITRDIVLGKNR